MTLAADAKINVDIADITLVQQGDEIDVKGNLVQATQNGQPAQVVADEITIKLAKPLSALSKKKVPRAATVPRSSSKSDKGADASGAEAARRVERKQGVWNVWLSRRCPMDRVWTAKGSGHRSTRRHFVVQLRQQLRHHLAGHVGQAEVAALEAVASASGGRGRTGAGSWRAGR